MRPPSSWMTLEAFTGWLAVYNAQPVLHQRELALCETRPRVLIIQKKRQNHLPNAASLRSLAPANCASCAVSSVVEHYLDTVGVRGSKPLSRTIFPPLENQRA